MAESSIGVVYIEVAPSGKDFGKKLEGDITHAADNAAKTGGTSILGKFGGAFGKIGKIGLGTIGTIAGGITALPPKAASNAPQHRKRASQTQRPRPRLQKASPKS